MHRVRLIAKSKYLDIDIKKEILNVGQDGLISDTRFNRPAKDGETFTDEGIYTITVRNNYTNRETEKKIYVGNNDILIAYVSNSELTIPEIISMVNSGAIIQEDGSIKEPESQTTETVSEKTNSLNAESTTTSSITDDSSAQENSEQKKADATHGTALIVLVIGAIVITAVASSVITILIMKKHRKTRW